MSNRISNIELPQEIPAQDVSSNVEHLRRNSPNKAIQHRTIELFHCFGVYCRLAYSFMLSRPWCQSWFGFLFIVVLAFAFQCGFSLERLRLAADPAVAKMARPGIVSPSNPVKGPRNTVVFHTGKLCWMKLHFWRLSYRFVVCNSWVGMFFYRRALKFASPFHTVMRFYCFEDFGYVPCWFWVSLMALG